MSLPPDLLVAAEDHRQYPRYRVSLPVDIALGRGKPIGYPGRALDLSVGGALLERTVSCVTGSLLTVRFLDPVGELPCDAIVRTVRHERGVGVEFVDVSNQDLRRLRALVTPEASR